VNKAATSLVACALIVGGEIAHAIEGGEYSNSVIVVSGGHTFPYDNRYTAAGLEHSHLEGPEEDMLNTTSSISASGGQAFEVYAVVTEGTLFSAVVSAKTLPSEKIYRSEEEATGRAEELQQQEVTDNIQYCVRPLA
jgi:hypothetical protein